MIRPCGRQGKEEDLEADDDEDGSETRPVRHGCGLGNSGKPGNIKYLNQSVMLLWLIKLIY